MPIGIELLLDEAFEKRDGIRAPALGQLNERQRAVLVLRYFNDLTEAQVAEVLGCSPGTVKSSASRGLARLRERLALLRGGR